MAKWLVEVEGINFSNRMTEATTVTVEARDERDAKMKADQMLPEWWSYDFDRVYYKARLRDE